MEYAPGQAGGQVNLPAAPEPNWAEKYGVTNLLASALEKTQYDYQQEAQRRMQQQKDEAAMAQAMAQAKSFEEQTKMKIEGDRKNALLSNFDKIPGIYAKRKALEELGMAEPIDTEMEQLTKEMESGNYNLVYSKFGGDIHKALNKIGIPVGDPIYSQIVLEFQKKAKEKERLDATKARIGGGAQAAPKTGPYSPAPGGGPRKLFSSGEESQFGQSYKARAAAENQPDPYATMDTPQVMSAILKAIASVGIPNAEDNRGPKYRSL